MSFLIVLFILISSTYSNTENKSKIVVEVTNDFKSLLEPNFNVYLILTEEGESNTCFIDKFTYAAAGLPFPLDKKRIEYNTEELEKTFINYNNPDKVTLSLVYDVKYLILGPVYTSIRERLICTSFYKKLIEENPDNVTKFNLGEILRRNKETPFKTVISRDYTNIFNHEKTSTLELDIYSE